MNTKRDVLVTFLLIFGLSVKGCAGYFLAYFYFVFFLDNLVEPRVTWEQRPSIEESHRLNCSVASGRDCLN